MAEDVKVTKEMREKGVAMLREFRRQKNSDVYAIIHIYRALRALEPSDKI
jgi:hypothetical protein